MKKNHEIWVRDSLGQYDQQKQKDDEYYASLVEEFSNNVIDIDNWRNWTSWVLVWWIPKIIKRNGFKVRYVCGIGYCHVSGPKDMNLWKIVFRILN